MKERWKQLAERYAALNLREKRIVALAAVVGVGMITFSLWVDPAQQRLAKLRKQIVEKQNEQATLQVQVIGLRGQLGDPDAGNRKALADTGTQLADTDGQIGRLEGVLVAPEKMPKLLQVLLARHRGLSLVGLKTLPAQAVIVEAVEGKEGGRSGEAPPPRPKPPGGDGNIYRHGLEIRLAGSYADLLAYVAELEATAREVRWEGMELRAAYPRSELSLRFHTLSLDADWLKL